jgi:hypothetical protein
VRVCDIGKKLNIPPEWSEGIDTGNPDIPPLFIINAQVSQGTAHRPSGLCLDCLN